MQRIFLFFSVLLPAVFLTSCKDRDPARQETPAEVQSPVTVTGISQDPLEDFIELNASSTFLLKNYVKANANGYLQSAHLQPGEYVKPGQTLFTIKTKEAESIGNAVNNLDTSFKFTGTNAIKTAAGGFISQLSHQSGDYVQDGEALAVISDASSFVFLLELPYELKPYIKIGDRLEVLLPDGEKLPGQVTALMPVVDAVAQTQNVVIRVSSSRTIPENLIGKVKIPKTIRNHAISLPRAAVLSNETQSEFWVMKMTDSTTAVKVPVKKGMETKDRIEILSPVFLPSDKILLTGNYGLGDTARVKIVQP
jgi:hypothetical protein